MRVFVAIPVPEDIKQYALMVREKLETTRPDIKWVEYENYHLTVKFLGEVEVKELEGIKRQLALVADAVPVFNLSAGGIGFFPQPSRPRVIWMDIKGEIDKAMFLCERTDVYLNDQGFAPEKNHRFHLTLGRIRTEKNLPAMMQILTEHTDWKKLRSFKVKEFHLMQSVLGAQGPQYTILDTYRLNG